MDKIRYEHILNSNAYQLAALLEVSSQSFYDSVTENRITVHLSKIEVGASKVGMKIGDFIEVLQDWISLRRKERFLRREMNDFLKNTHTRSLEKAR